MSGSSRWLLAALLGWAIVSSAGADVVAGAPFGDGMVVQRDRAFPVWGTAAPGERIRVRFQEAAADGIAGADGGWTVRLPPSRVGGPNELVISGVNTLRFTDVWVGDVWLCAGQSNMAMKLRAVAGGREAMRRARNPALRLLHFEGTGDGARWAAANPQGAGDFSAICYLFGDQVQGRSGVPVGLIDVSLGGTPIESWIADDAFDTSSGLRDLREAAAARGPRRMGQMAPAAMFDSRIRPLVGYPLKGVVWYQGEANASRGGAGYDLLLETLIGNWRNAWADPMLPFLYVQLPGFGGAEKVPGGWAEVRAAQAAVARRVPGTAMIGATDLTDERLHSPNKAPVAERLALAARAMVYGERVRYAAPQLTSAVRRGAEVLVRWTPADAVLRARGDEVRGFVVAGSDGVWHPADARLAGGVVRVVSAAVPRPLAVRYAWTQELGTNLFDVDGLPVEPWSASVEDAPLEMKERR